MRSGTRFLWLSILLLITSGCEYDEDFGPRPSADDGPKLVLFGELYPKGVEIRISQSAPVGKSFSPSDLVPPEDTQCLLWVVDSLVGELTYDVRRKRYYLEQELDVSLHYEVTATAPGLEPVRSDALRFPPPALHIDVVLPADGFEDGQTSPLIATLVSENPTYYVLLPLVEEHDGTDYARGGLVGTDYDALYRDECGIVGHDQRHLALSTDCTVGDTTRLDGFLRYANFYYNELTRPVIVPDSPRRVGVRAGTISIADFNYFKSLRKNQNFFEDYLTVEALDQFNIQEGYGRIVVINSPQPTWVDLK